MVVANVGRARRHPRRAVCDRAGQPADRQTHTGRRVLIVAAAADEPLGRAARRDGRAPRPARYPRRLTGDGCSTRAADATPPPSSRSLLDELRERTTRGRADARFPRAEAGVYARAAGARARRPRRACGVTGRDACFRTGAGASDPESRVTGAPAQRPPRVLQPGERESGDRETGTGRGWVGVPTLWLARRRERTRELTARLSRSVREPCVNVASAGAWAGTRRPEITRGVFGRWRLTCCVARGENRAHALLPSVRAAVRAALFVGHHVGCRAGGCGDGGGAGRGRGARVRRPRPSTRDSCGPTFVVPAWGDAGGWTDPSKYSTIQLADVNGDGSDELIARNDQGMEIYWFDTSVGQWRPQVDAKGRAAGLDGLSLAAADRNPATDWTKPQYYSTIQAATSTASPARRDPRALRGRDARVQVHATGPGGSINGGTWQPRRPADRSATRRGGTTRRCTRRSARSSRTGRIRITASSSAAQRRRR